jgi:glucan phosphoethanolaminetransferase (alkaline phosphatase superfamily)
MSRQDRYCLVALAVMYATPILAMIIWASAKQPVLTVAALLLVGALLFAVTSASTRVWRYFFLLQFPFALLSLAFAFYTIHFGMPPGETLAEVLVGTSWEEIRGFLGMTHGYWMAFGLLAWIVCYIGCALKLSPEPIFNARIKSMARVLTYCCVVIAAYCVTRPDQMVYGMSLNPIVGGAMFVIGNIPKAIAALHGSNINKRPYQAHGNAREEVHILVIGESVRRESWSAYGYTRSTTPYLDAMKSDLVLLQSAVADANLTSWSVPMILTGMTPEHFALGNVRGNLVDLAKEGGYSTAWLVNQDLNMSRSVGIDPDRFEFAPDPKANIFGRAVLDGSLLPGYLREIRRSGSARFIGIHMMGSHWEYFRRYPPAFQRFGSGATLQSLSIGSLFLTDSETSAALVDAYDNSILYTDWFLKQLIDGASALSVPATLMFFPDHGEDLQQLDGSKLHGLPVYTRHAFDIPAFVWVNQAFRTAHPDMIAALQANAGKEIRSHDVFYTEAQLMGITWPGADDTRSFTSSQFVPDTAMMFAAGGTLVTRQ